MDRTIKPCPFCGGVALFEKENIMYPGKNKHCFGAIVCQTEGCPANNICQDDEQGGFKISWTLDEAIAVWNGRVDLKGGDMKLTVIFRNDAPMIFCNDSPSYRTVVIDLTQDQIDKLQPMETHKTGGHQFYESVSKAILEQ